MMTLDHVGDKEAMVDAQLGQQPLARTTETLPFPRIFENSKKNLRRAPEKEN